MSTLAPLLESFFTECLVGQRAASPHTIAAYRDTFRLLLRFTHDRVGTAPARLDLAQLDAPLIGAFLTHLEVDRHNRPSTRNARLGAIHSFFTYVALRCPEHAGLIQRVLALPYKRTDRALVSFLTADELAALLASPDQRRWIGRRDYTLLALVAQTGLRVSEVVALRVGDVHLGTRAHVHCRGKGRKDRVTPLTTHTADALRNWLKDGDPTPALPLFPTSTGRRLSRDAVALVVARHARAAAADCPSLSRKHVTPHVLRHTSAMALLHAGIDTSVIALWLGHETTRTTQIYLHADLALKERALARTAPTTAATRRYRPPDSLLAFLEAI
ncbi:MAG TPA: tyrosine-type recombinase/integrase [Acidimicrobiia bacterium]|nr:tyrosine-type recombinase/integrase [Acidimicrobiia bacterium]